MISKICSRCFLRIVKNNGLRETEHLLRKTLLALIYGEHEVSRFTYRIIYNLLPLKTDIVNDLQMIRLATSKDFDFVYDLYMHPEINPFLLYENMTMPSFEPIFYELIQNQLLYVFEMAHKPVGMFKFIPLKHRNAHIAYLGGIAIDPTQGGKGYGVMMMREIIDLGKSKGLLRIELSVAVGNQKAISLYERSGFKKEGVLQKYTHLKSENRFVDEVMMAYLYP